ncbi:MAG: right-handed parallel beta-helix repeat-containing protein [Candidatus Cloacimonetes bacterium]|nr:right-handed parallel beta-helix repeat-containing protein [Candidatus Cloacimonadota bacterium]
MKKLIILIIMIFLTFFVSIISATIINVPDDQPTIQAGINVSVDGDTVLVQPGNYVENINYNGKNITVASLFLTTQDTTYISQTIIDGDSIASVVTFQSGEDSTAFLNGFTITNGYSVKGGGIYCVNNSSPVLDNITVTNNNASGGLWNYGGGIYCNNSSPSLDNVTIAGNSVSSNERNFGGGLCCANNSFPNLDNVTITGNSAWEGTWNYAGGIFCSNSSPNLYNVTITGNIASEGTWNYGGGIYCDSDSSPYLDSVIITENSVSGGTWNIAGGIGCEINSSPSLVNVTITNNSASGGEGGGLFCNLNSSPSLENVTITDNIASSGGGIYCKHNSCPSLNNVVVNDNNANHSGGGISCIHGSAPILENVIIMNNNAETGYGGGIYCFYESSPILENVTIINNNSNWHGGGIFLTNNSCPNLENVTISNNSAFRAGGGIYCKFDSSPSFVNVTITYNNSNWDGGGIYLWYNSSPNLQNVTIKYNSAGHVAGGIYCENNSCPNLENVTITENDAYNNGGGIYCWINSSINFNNTNRSSIYSNTINNQRGGGSDIYSQECEIIDVVVDTFTVMNPSDYYTSPIDYFTFDIQHSVIDSLINADLYVSVNGDNSNIGTEPEQPLKTISHALKMIYADNLNHNTIHLAPGIYSDYTNGETYPLHWSNYVSLSGSGEDITILDANNTARVMEFVHITDASIKDVKIKNGYASGLWGNSYGGGIYCYYYSSPDFKNVSISNNNAVEHGGGIYCNHISSPSFENVAITDNSSGHFGGGIFCSSHSNPNFTNVTISGNSADSCGGAFWCYLHCYPTLINCILWNDIPQEIFTYSGLLNSTYSDIQGGWTGEGNIDEDPLFADPQNGDFHLTWANFPIPDSTMSPCIDTGDPNSPFDPDGTIADMGAYYYEQGTGTDNYELHPAIAGLKLSNYPNPFNPKTTISFNLTSEDTESTEIIIYNIKGQKIKQYSLFNNQSSIIWNGKDENNKPVSSGVYFYKLKVNNKNIAIKKCLLLK